MGQMISKRTTLAQFRLPNCPMKGRDKQLPFLFSSQVQQDRGRPKYCKRVPRKQPCSAQGVLQHWLCLFLRQSDGTPKHRRSKLTLQRSVYDTFTQNYLKYNTKYTLKTLACSLHKCQFFQLMNIVEIDFLTFTNLFPNFLSF